jgi:hypothetical protein
MTLHHWKCNHLPSEQYTIEVKHAFYPEISSWYATKPFDDIVYDYANYLVVNWRIVSKDKKAIVYIASLTEVREKITALKCRHFDLLQRNRELDKITTEIQNLSEVIKASEKEGFDY